MTNITVATFAGGVKVVQTEPLHQYDYGQILRFVGIDDAMDSSDNYEVHFSNSDLSGSAKAVVGGTSGVIIPDEYLASGADIHAWIYTHTGASDQDEEYTDGRTSYEVIIPVLKRARPSDMPPTPTGRDTMMSDIIELQGDVHDINDDIDALTPRVSTLEGTATSLQGQITALGTVSNTSMTFVGRSITLYKYGKVVTFSFGGNSTMDIPARTDFNAGTLPVGYRPAVTCTNYLFNSGQYMLQISFSNTGTVSLYNFGTSVITANQGWMRGSYTFITP